MSANHEISNPTNVSYSKLFFKYIFRTIHMGTYAFIFGNLFFDHFWGTRSILRNQKNQYKYFHIISSIMLILSGLVNMFILIKENSYVKDVKYKIWSLTLYLKFFLTMTITPLLEKFYPAFLLPENKNDHPSYYLKLRLIIACIAFLLSPFLRYLRENFLTQRQSFPQAGTKVSIN